MRCLGFRLVLVFAPLSLSKTRSAWGRGPPRPYRARSASHGIPTIQRDLLTAWMVLSSLVIAARLLLALLTLPLRSRLSVQLEILALRHLLKMMVKQVRLAPTRMEFELYDHPTVIEDWDDGPEGWFHERLCWLPLLDDLRNWMSSEECRELAAVV